jgi:sodium/bile acid cotransporter 7
MTATIARYWFVVLLIAALALGAVAWPVAQPIAEARPVRWGIVAAVMWCMAWPLETAVVLRAVRRPWPALLASVINIGVVPLLAWPFLGLLGPELGAGLIVAAATPCTLAAASVWTRRAGGNDAVSMLVTLMTNSACFVVTPFWLWLLIGRSSNPQVFADLMVALIWIVLVPIVVAQLTRLHRGIARYATSLKTALGTVAQVAILTMVFLGSVETAARLAQSSTRVAPLSLAATAVIVAAIHFGTLAGSVWLARRLKCPRGDQIAVGFSASQKTLMVGLTSAMELGLSVIPIVTYHAIQLIGDTSVAHRWRRSEPRNEKNTTTDTTENTD